MTEAVGHVTHGDSRYLGHENDLVRVLTIIPSLQIGGAEAFFVRLACALAQKHQVTAYIEHMCYTNNGLLDELRRSSVQVCWTPFTDRVGRHVSYRISKLGRLISPRLDLVRWLERKALRRLHHRQRFDVVNPHLTLPELAACDAFLDDLVPIVATDHGDYRLPTFHSLAKDERFARLYRRTDALILPSNDNALGAAGIPRKEGFQQRVIYYGFDPFRPGPKVRPEGARFVFGVAARGIPSKGWGEVLAAFVQGFDQFPKGTHLMLVGGSDYLDGLKAEVPLRLRGHVHFAGPQSEPGPWIQGFDCGILASYYPSESLPNMIIECLVFGVPVIATRQGGISEMLETPAGTAGVLLTNAPGTPARVNELEAAMVRMAGGAAAEEELKTAVHDAGERFSMSLCVQQYEETFQSLATGRRGHVISA